MRNHVENQPLILEKTTKNQVLVFVKINGSNDFDTQFVSKRDHGVL